jgi:hypothetical protein
MNKDTVTIYWTPSRFTEWEENWNFLYQDPVSTVVDLNTIRNKNVKEMFACPSYVNSMKNVFVFKNVLPTNIELGDDFYAPKPQYPFDYSGKSKVQLTNVRESSLEGYVNARYNMGWLLFSDEPVEVRFTAPYFPGSSPVEGAMLSTGEFNIGNWYRDYVLDYHIPIGAKEFILKEDQPLFYLEVKTNKKVVFQRYNLTQELRQIALECITSPKKYESNMPLSYRYDIFKKTASRERVLSYIKESLITGRTND